MSSVVLPSVRSVSSDSSSSGFSCGSSDTVRVGAVSGKARGRVVGLGRGLDRSLGPRSLSASHACALGRALEYAAEGRVDLTLLAWPDQGWEPSATNFDLVVSHLQTMFAEELSDRASLLRESSPSLKTRWGLNSSKLYHHKVSHAVGQHELRKNMRCVSGPVRGGAR